MIRTSHIIRATAALGAVMAVGASPALADSTVSVENGAPRVASPTADYMALDAIVYSAEPRKGGSGDDKTFGGEGDDTVLSQDDVLDQDSCGNGNDTVAADTLDGVAPDCETVNREDG